MPRPLVRGARLCLFAAALVLLSPACEKYEQQLTDLEDQINAAKNCAQGMFGCSCKDGLCAAGLTCTDVLGYMACLPLASCPPGTFGCPCYKDGSCDPDDAGAPQACVAKKCAATGCAAGERGCPCLPGWACVSNADVCDNGMCLADTGQTLVPPTNPSAVRRARAATSWRAPSRRPATARGS